MIGQRKTLAVLFITILLGPMCNAHRDERENNDCNAKHAASVVGGVAAVAAVTWGIAALGFGPAGIAAHSVASTLMSAASTYGVGVSVIAAAQSAGAVGLGAAAKAGVFAAGAAATHAATGGCSENSDGDKDGCH